MELVKKFEFILPDLYSNKMSVLKKSVDYLDTLCALVEKKRDAYEYHSASLETFVDILGKGPVEEDEWDQQDYGWKYTEKIDHTVYLVTPGNDEDKEPYVLLEIVAHRINDLGEYLDEHLDECYKKDFEEFKKEWIRSATNEKA